MTELFKQVLFCYMNDDRATNALFKKRYGMLPKEFISHNYQQIQKIYKGRYNRPFVIYRGLYFTSHQKLTAFLSSISNGYLIENTITSWTYDFPIAYLFSLYRPLTVNRSYGCIISTSIIPTQVISLREFKNSKYKEFEYILPPGKYKVDIIDYDLIIKE